jgi:Ca2+-binding EF-hand superfamily protein
MNVKDVVELAFHAFDKDEDGKVNFEEFLSVLKKVEMFKSMSEEEAKKWFSQIDKNKEGTLSMENFLEYAKEHPEYVAIAKGVLEKSKAFNH